MITHKLEAERLLKKAAELYEKLPERGKAPQIQVNLAEISLLAQLAQVHATLAGLD